MISINVEEGLYLPFKIGQYFSRKICFDSASVSSFATLVGDSNPLHHDKKVAEKSRFSRLIASGTHTSSVLAAMVASKLCSLRPSLGLEMSFSFQRAVYADVEMIARWELAAIESNSKLKGDIVTFTGQLFTFDKTLLVSGRVISLVT